MATVTSENKAEFDREFMEKQGILKKDKPKDKPKDEQFERVRNHPKYAKLKASLGKKGAMDAILKQLNDAQ
jgi:hypothetical protein